MVKKVSALEPNNWGRGVKVALGKIGGSIFGGWKISWRVYQTLGSTNIAIAGMAGPGLSRWKFPIERGDIPASYVSLPLGSHKKPEKVRDQK